MRFRYILTEITVSLRVLQALFPVGNIGQLYQFCDFGLGRTYGIGLHLPVKPQYRVSGVCKFGPAMACTAPA